MPGASYGQLGAFVNGKFYAISGFATNRVGIYDPTNNSWTTGTPLPADTGYNLRIFYGCAVVGTKIYVIGGDTGGSGARATNYAYDTATNTWAVKAVLPGGARWQVAAVNLSGKVYVIGGIDSTGVFSRRVDVYDPVANTWTTRTSLPVPARAGMVAEAINGKIYLAGGSDGTNSLTTALVFNGANPGTWTSIASMPIGGNGHSAVLNNKLFVMGCGSPANQVQAYDPVSNTWDTNYSTLPVARPDDGAVAADQVSGTIYDAGGYNGQSLDRLDILPLGTLPPVITSPLNLDYLSANEVFDPVSNTWTTKARMPTAREGFGIASASGGQDGNWAVAPASMPNPTYGFGAAFVNGKFYAISGFMFGGNLDVRVYDPVTGQWSFGAPLPADVLRQFFGCAVVGTKIYVIGGDAGVNPGARDTNYAYDTATNTWATLKVLPGGPRWGLTAVTLNGKIYVIGGLDVNGNRSTRADIYDPSTDTWSVGKALPVARTQVAAEVINGKIYLAGGNSTSGNLSTALVFDPAHPTVWTSIASMPIPGSFHGQSAVIGGQFYIIGCGQSPASDNVVQAYDPIANTWSTNLNALLPYPRANGGAAGDDASGKIYFTGGDVSQTEFIGELDILSIAPGPEKIYVAGGAVAACPSSPIATLEAYSPDTDSSVTSLPPMPTARANLGAATVSSVVYFVGGQTGCSGAVGNVEAYNVATKSWAGKHAMTFPRSEVGIGVINNKIYAVGGNNGTGVPQSKLEVYDPSTDFWTSLPDMPTARIAPVVEVVNNVLYVIGGYDSSHPNGFTQVESYNPSGGWTPGLASLPTGRSSGAGGGVLNNKIYVFGGVNSSHEVSTDEVYDPATNTWSTAAPMPTARFGLRGAVINNNLYAVGGVLTGIATVGQQFTYQITATNHPTVYGASGLPPGLSINTASGIISGKPTTPSYNSQVQVTATNGAGTGSATLAFSVQDAPPPAGPVIVNSTSATARIGQNVSFNLFAQNASTSAMFAAGGLPPGLSIDLMTGLISGIPTSAGNFAVSVSVTDGAATSNTNVQLTIISDSTVPIITSTDSAAAIPGQPFSYTLTADAAATFDIVVGTLPAGLSLNQTTGVISGIYNGPYRSHVIKKEPPLVVQPTATNSNGTGTSPLNLFVPAIAGFSTSVNGYPLLQFVGVPLKNHDIESTTDFVNYTYVTTLTADANGRFDFEDTTPGVFYRLRYPSAMHPNRPANKTAPQN